MLLKCPYLKICNLYQANSETCNVDPGPYCGRYRIFQEKGIPPIASTRATKQAHDSSLHYTTENIPKKEQGVHPALQSIDVKPRRNIPQGEGHGSGA